MNILKKTVVGFVVVALGVPVLVAGPMIDDAHDRVQTTFDPGPGYERIGTVAQRDVRSVGRSSLAIDCSMLPRGYGDFERIKDYLPPLGIVRVRLHAGWAKLEPKPGEWDFGWLDRQVDWLIEHGMQPLLETSYGNPSYPGAGGASLSDGMPRGETALAAWDRYVEKLARHYPHVKDWACWNEPNNSATNTPEIVVDNNIRTAQIIRKHIPDARIAMLTLGGWRINAFTEPCLKLFKERDAVRLFTSIIYHDYSQNPDASYPNKIDEWVKTVRTYAPELKIWNGESGATSDPHYSAGVSSQKWNSELTQAKWDTRRLIADLGHGYDSLVFTIYDPCYDNVKRYTNRQPVYWVSTRPGHFMKRMGLIKCNDRLEVTKVKSAYYAVQNVASLFDAALVPEPLPVRYHGEILSSATAFYTFRQKSSDAPVIAFWNASNHPENDNRTGKALIEVPDSLPLREPVLVDMVTGAVYAIPETGIRQQKTSRLFTLPIYDAPLLLTEKSFALKGE